MTVKTLAPIECQDTHVSVLPQATLPLSFNKWYGIRSRAAVGLKV